MMSGVAHLTPTDRRPPVRGRASTDLCYGYNALWVRGLPFISLEFILLDVPSFEMEALIALRIAEAEDGMNITEAPLRGQTFCDNFSVLGPSTRPLRRMRRPDSWVTATRRAPLTKLVRYIGSRDSPLFEHRHLAVVLRRGVIRFSRDLITSDHRGGASAAAIVVGLVSSATCFPTVTVTDLLQRTP